MRIALHAGRFTVAGPDHRGRRCTPGPHTSRTARIEPITPPGQVYTWSAFAAVAAATGVDDLASTTSAAPSWRRYGSLALYCVRPVA